MVISSVVPNRTQPLTDLMADEWLHRGDANPRRVLSRNGHLGYRFTHVLRYLLSLDTAKEFYPPVPRRRQYLGIRLHIHWSYAWEVRRCLHCADAVLVLDIESVCCDFAGQ